MNKLSPAVPCPNLYVQLNALQLVLDSRSLVWLNLFALDLRQSLEQFMELYKLNDSQKPDEHVDIRVDGLMLKVEIQLRLHTSSIMWVAASVSNCILIYNCVLMFVAGGPCRPGEGSAWPASLSVSADL